MSKQKIWGQRFQWGVKASPKDAGLGRSFVTPPRTPFDERVRKTQQALLAGDCEVANGFYVAAVMQATPKDKPTLKRLQRAMGRCRVR